MLTFPVLGHILYLKQSAWWLYYSSTNVCSTIYLTIGYWWTFTFSFYYTNGTINIFMHKAVLYVWWFFLGYIPQSGISELKGFGSLMLLIHIVKLSSKRAVAIFMHARKCGNACGICENLDWRAPRLDGFMWGAPSWPWLKQNMRICLFQPGELSAGQAWFENNS